MQSPKINNLYNEYKELYEYLLTSSQTSYAISVDNNYKKALLISCASFFEFTITNAILKYVKLISENNEVIINFVQKKALERQYHTLFDWDSTNANKFFILFGENFKRKAREIINQRNLMDSERTFIEIGKKRNVLVHDNFIESTVNDTCDDIYKKYIQAEKFVDLIIEMLN